MSRWLVLPLLLLALLLLLAAPAGAQTFLACRFEAGTRLRLALEPRGLALQLPGRQLWQDADELTSLRDPVIGGFTLPIPPEAGGRLPAHDRFTLSLERLTGEARLALSRLPPPAQVQACRDATAATAAARPNDSNEPPSLPPPCDLPVPVATLAGSCEPLRTRF
jgi:hypothetical protein